MSVTCKIDNSAYLHFLSMSPDPYFYLISVLYFGNHSKYYNDTLKDYTTGQYGVSHARMKTLLFFIYLIISPDACSLIHIAVGKPGISTFLLLVNYPLLLNFICNSRFLQIW